MNVLDLLVAVGTLVAIGTFVATGTFLPLQLEHLLPLELLFPMELGCYWDTCVKFMDPFEPYIRLKNLLTPDPQQQTNF